MGLLKKLFGNGDAVPDTQPQSSQFQESETTAHRTGSTNAPRRELVQVVLRDTMRKHGIPSDWIDCRILSVVTRKRVSGMHVQFIVSKAESQLMEFVHPFQHSFWQEIEKFDPQAREWLLSLAWQFGGSSARDDRSRGQIEWNEEVEGDTQPLDGMTDELSQDLHALYAIRDAALAESPEAPSPSHPGNRVEPKFPAGS
jgi:hypothetical protein